MNKRIRNKIIRRFQDLDDLLVQCFLVDGGFKHHKFEIRAFRGAIQYWKRRYPSLYAKAFGTDFDIGHFNAGR